MKEYTLQEKSFTLKKRSLKVRRDTIDMFRNVQKHINEYTFDSKKFYDEAQENEKEMYKANYDADLQIGLYTFFADENNLKSLFEKTLDGDISSINYQVETDEAIDELIKFGVDVFNDFFMNSSKEQTQPTQ